MEINKTKQCGIELISLENSKGLKVTFTDLAASMYRIQLGNKDLLLTPCDLETFKVTGYHGKTIGRIGNRIEKGIIDVDGQKYQIQINEADNCLHGGVDSFSFRYFKSVVESNDKFTTVIYTYTSPDGEAGFPGNCNVKVTYTVYENDNRIDIDFASDVDKPCPIALTNHAFFTLGNRDCLDLKLMIDADEMTDVRSTDLIALGRTKVNDVTSFKQLTRIGNRVKDESIFNHRARGYDFNYYLNGNEKDTRIVLQGTEHSLEIKTDFKCTQIYTCNWPDETKFYGCDCNVYQGIAIEPQDDLCHRDILRPGEVYKRKITYLFK